MIEVRNLTKKFDDFTAVADVSLTVREGETFACLGSNGSGKSTILKCLAGLVLPTGGEIFINGLNIAKRKRESRRMLSYLPQRPGFHDSLTAREVLEFYCRLRKMPAGRIEKVLHESEYDFNGFSEKRVRELSGGMTQRLGLAVACLADAPVMLLDEPTVSLDPEGALAFRRYLKKLKAQGKTIIFSSHILSDVEELADRVLILVGGRAVAVESIENLRSELNRQSRMRIVLREFEPRSTEVLKRAGASEIAVYGRELLVSSPEKDRFAMLEALKRAGIEVLSFETEKSNLEDIYLTYAQKQTTKPD